MYLGERGARIAQSEKIQDIWTTLFPEPTPLVPASQLLDICERKIVENSRMRVFNLSKLVEETDTLAKALLRKTEYSEVKSILLRIKNDKPIPSNLLVLPRQKTYSLDSWPDVKAIFAKSRFPWLNESSLEDIGDTENKLDKQYYLELWDAAATIPEEKNGAIRMLIEKEISYQNLMWAIRVRRYYGYGRERTLPMLVELPEVNVTLLASSMFDINIDDPASLRTWKFSNFLDNQKPETPLDAPLLETRLQRDLFIHVRRSLHMYPFTYTPLYCYFKFSEAEEAVLLGILEGIRFNASLQEKVAHAWALSGEAS
jgi:hypothetical protein